MKIGVCIPVYEAPFEFLKRTIASVISQSEGLDLEIVVNDDHSTTDYTHLISEFSAHPIIFSVNSENLGMVKNWNATVRKSRGDLVLLLGQDDILKPDMIKTYLNEFSKKEDIVFCSSARQFIDQNNNVVTLKRAVNDRDNIFVNKKKYYLNHDQVTRLCLRNGNAIGEPSAVMFRRKAFDIINGYDNSFHHAADVDFNIRMSSLGQAVYFNYPFLMRRIHSNNLTKSNFFSGKVSQDRRKLYEKFSGSIGFSKSDIAAFKAYLVAKSFYDLIRAFTSRQWHLASYAANGILTYAEFEPRIYCNYIREIITHRNLSAM